MDCSENKTVKKTFKSYYADDEFRLKHLLRLKEKIPCECGKSISRSNMLKHQNTKVHKKFMEAIVLKEEENSEKELTEIEERRIDKFLAMIEERLKSRQ
jgi:hypothetical protein